MKPYRYGYVKVLGLIYLLLILTPLCLFLQSCSFSCIRKNVKDTFTPTDIKILKYHIDADLHDIEDLMQRLYLKNPKYEPDKGRRQQKMDAIFRQGRVSECDLFHLPSDQILTMTFEQTCPCSDRVFMLGLGLSKSIREAYSVDGFFFVTGSQIPAERLERLYYNLGRVNWLMKTARDTEGNLLFITNEAGENGYINMEYEKIFTRLLTRTADDIYMRDGLINNFIFRAGATFLSILTL